MNIKLYFSPENKLARRIQRLVKKELRQKWIVGVDIREYKIGRRYEILFYQADTIDFVHIKVDKYSVGLFDHNIREADAKKIQRVMFTLFFR